jgi:hypothetical protein
MGAGQAVEVVDVEGVFLVNQPRKKLNSAGYRIAY